MPSISTQVVVEPLIPARLDDFLAFFDHDAFPDNPRWASCYCQCFYEDHAKVRWSERTAPENRRLAIVRAKAREMQGYLAYFAGKVVGFCNAAPRTLLRALDDEPIEDADAIGCIVCFIVAPEMRGKGVATSLLAAACDGLRAQGLRFVESNPRPAADTAAANHFGPLKLYLASGFSVVRDSADGSVWVRKAL
jgi:GNAT superfamily N-acetyltransferase